MYSNGRIYVNTNVTPNVGVSIGDLQRCFAAVIEATIAGQTVRKLSGDLAVYCALKTGDTFTDGGVTWRVVSRGEINPWARYRPIPCHASINGVENNRPVPISDQVRYSENFGFDKPIDLFKAWDEAAYNDYVEKVAKYGEYWMPMLPFRDDRWKRLTDFVKTNSDGTAAGNVGYDHNAKPDKVEVTITGGSEQINGTHILEPLVSDGRRYIVIPPGSTSAGRYHFPNDHLWMDLYYQKVYGTSPSARVDIYAPHPEWLSPIDLMGAPDYGSIVDGGSYYASVRRRIAIFKMRNNAWYVYALVTDNTTAADGWNLRSRPFESCPKAWVDFTDSGNPPNVYIYPDGSNDTLGTITGRILVVECWISDKSSQNIMPIPGFTYELNIIRQNIQITVDIDDTLYFWYVDQQSYNAETGSDVILQNYTVMMYYDISVLGYLDTTAKAKSKLREYYDSLTVSIGNYEVDMLNGSGIEYFVGATPPVLDYTGLGCLFLEDIQDALHGQTAIITAKRKNTGSIPGQTKDILIYAGDLS